MGKDIEEELYQKAKKVRKNAYAPYSGFKVGAAVLVKSGKIFTGCNIENAAYGLTICAERTAIFKAVSEGFLNIEKLLLVADTKKLITPCGSCRQVLSEFGSEINVIKTNLNGKKENVLIKELLPDFFSKGDMKDE